MQYSGPPSVNNRFRTRNSWNDGYRDFRGLDITLEGTLPRLGHFVFLSDRPEEDAQTLTFLTSRMIDTLRGRWKTWHASRHSMLGPSSVRFPSTLRSITVLRLAAIIVTVPPVPFVPEHLHGRQVLLVEAFWAGPIEDGERALMPMRRFGEPAADAMGPIPYTVLQKLGDEAAPWGAHYYDKMRYLTRLDEDAIDVILAYATCVTSPMTEIHVFPLGGAVSRLPEDHTAMGNRDTAFVLWIIATWCDPHELKIHRNWARNFWGAMQPFSTGRKYLNADTDSTSDQVRSSYRPETYERLVALKNKYDPTNFFRLNPNITPEIQSEERSIA